MDIDKLKEILQSLKFHSEQADALQELLYNSLLTLNGILITAFSIMVAVNPRAYSSFFPPFFITSFIPIVIIVALIFDMRQSAYAEEAKVTIELDKTIPGVFKEAATLATENIKLRTNKISGFLRFLERTAIILSLFNPIFIFLIIYNCSMS